MTVEDSVKVVGSALGFKTERGGALMDTARCIFDVGCRVVGGGVGVRLGEAVGTTDGERDGKYDGYNEGDCVVGDAVEPTDG